MGLFAHRHVLLPYGLPHREFLARLQDLGGRALPHGRGPGESVPWETPSAQAACRAAPIAA
ncbi:hypothetical protein SAV31267_033990 [Streptomyces avermitilis]|uniref:Uncharacterized protein n=1 Tax=Streptomyces avermitilis TaxID=33903 RepID=A0A4D4MQF8_STRAX|nr:hypothetical protein SAV31267_033990 [Streptomyces avermitilis]